MNNYEVFIKVTHSDQVFSWEYHNTWSFADAEKKALRTLEQNMDRPDEYEIIKITKDY